MKIIIDNIATEYLDQGHGDVILFLHGWQDNLHTFDSLTDLLVQKYRVIRLDLPGFGETETPPSTWALQDYVDFVAKFLAKLNINAKYLVGHSFGGRVIIKGVATSILMPSKIVLIASAGLAKSNTSRNQLFKIVAKIGKLITAIPPFVIFRNTLRKKLYTAAGSDYLGAGALKNIYLNVIHEDLSHLATKISVPTLLIWGSEDDQTPLADGKFLNQAIKNSNLVVIEGEGHFVHQAEPNNIAQMIERFCV